MNPTSEHVPIHYADKKIGLVVYPIIGISFLFFANDNPFIEHVQLPSFFSDLIFALVVSLFIGAYLGWLVRFLDQRTPWLHKIKKRIFVQSLFGILLPLTITMLLEVIYLWSIGISFGESAILDLELPLTFIYLVLVNLFYMTNYFMSNRNINLLTTVKPTPQETLHIIVQHGNSEKSIDINDCALIKSTNKVLWLKTYNDQEFHIKGTLHDWENKLPSARFYRLNRNYIVAHRAIKSIEPTDARKLKVNFISNEAFTLVSKNNASNFKLWWKETCPL